MRILVATVLAIAMGFGVYSVADSAVPTLPKLKSGDPLPADLFVKLAKVVNPAVVNIYTTYLPKHRRPRLPYNDPFFEMFEQFMRQGPSRPQESLGSGFIIREDGLIVTNNHVIDRADIIKVKLDEHKSESFDAKVIGKDSHSDIALIKIDAKRKLPFVKMGSSSEVEVGEWVAAFGNPYGYGHTMTKGIISAVGREIDELNLFPFMQTDASINPGNSGGPLVNTQGLVIGVNAAIDQRAQGIGFVIPIDNVKTILPALEKEGTIKRGRIGVLLADIGEEHKAALNLKQTEGALITDVVPNSPAEKAGLEPYDLIVEYNGKKIESTRDITKAVAATPVGQKATIKVIRDGKTKTLTVTVGSAEQVAQGFEPSSRERRSSGIEAPYSLGFRVADYSNQLAKEFHLPRLKQPHPVIIHVDPRSEAGRSGLAPGDIILDVNRSEVSRASDVPKRLKGGTVNILRVMKQNRVVLVSLRAS